jgi:hypothetical protein
MSEKNNETIAFCNICSKSLQKCKCTEEDKLRYYHTTKITMENKIIELFLKKIIDAETRDFFLETLHRVDMEDVEFDLLKYMLNSEEVMSYYNYVKDQVKTARLLGLRQRTDD